MRKHVKKISQHLLEAAIATIVFLLVLMLLPHNSKNTDQTKQLQDNMHFVVHKSADDWETFFDDNDLDEILTGELKDEVLAMLEAEESGDSKDTKDLIVNTNDTNPDTTYTNRENKKSCKLPRIGQNLQHGEFVLAYKQRKDVSSICEVERRFCNDGTLLGSFTQRSCKENISYEYTEYTVKPYNTLPANPYIQPDEIQTNYYADFDTKGKINGDAPTQIDYRNNNINNPTAIYSQGTNQLEKSLGVPGCTTPRGENIKHMQFVKAYKYSKGYKDRPCEVELRYCIQGDLIGERNNPQCTYYDRFSDESTPAQYQKPGVIDLIENLL